jgi:hypothetical protein
MLLHQEQFEQGGSMVKELACAAALLLLPVASPASPLPAYPFVLRF